MSYSLENISNSLESRIQKNGSGYIKLGFEGGKLVAANFYNNPTEEEKKFPKIKQDFDLRNEIGEALKSSFYGTLGFVFSESRITNYCKSQTWKGSTLELFIRG